MFVPPENWNGLTAYRVYGYRWVNLAVFGLTGFAMGFSVMGPTALVGSVAKEWSVGFSDANMALVVLGGVFGSLLGLPVGRACDRFGYKLPSVIGATVASVGLLLRGTANSWNAFLVYNAIAALGGSATMSGIGTLIRNWFPTQEIGQANGLSMVLAPLGGAAGTYAVFPLIESVGWSRMWLITGIVYAMATLLSWILFKEKPDLPPSPGSLRPVKREGFVRDLKQVMNRTNVLLQIVRIAFTGLLSLAPALLPVVFASRAIPPKGIGIVMGLFNLVGVPAMVVLPGQAFRLGLPKLAMACSMFVAAIAFIAAFYAPISAGSIWLAIALSTVVGTALAVIGPISMSIGMMQPGVNSGNVGTLSGVGSAVMGVGRLVLPPIVGALVDGIGATAGAWLVTVVVLIAGVVTVVLIPEPKAQVDVAPAMVS
jgi:NNP family nitrate/nitrite transporter-like MFS transporter